MGNASFKMDYNSHLPLMAAWVELRISYKSSQSMCQVCSVDSQYSANQICVESRHADPGSQTDMTPCRNKKKTHSLLFLFH